MAGTTGLEPATSAVTGQHSNQLNYVPSDCVKRARKALHVAGYCEFIAGLTPCANSESVTLTPFRL